MAGKKKFGTFAGVFTPSILTILGVIMYMRLGWVVGHAGLIGTIAIILIAHVIAITTGLSVSSVATDKKIGAGGIYYVLSRSMGIPIGGAIGIALYVGTAFSIALYLIGFAESFNDFMGLGMTVNDFRITGTVSLIALTALALISTSAALKAQFFILAAIVVSLVSIFFGSMEFSPDNVSMFAPTGAEPMSVVFAIFFPAVTGFTAGIAMSGDLKDPKKSIPRGTLFAIGTGLVVYLGLAIFLAFAVDPERLQTDYNILKTIAYFGGPAVIAGIWGATLSSALGGILGGPRILQAMSLDGVTPKFFGKGKGKDNEPVNALLFVFVIAEAGILIGELGAIAGIVSMFYLATYGFINISFFLEKVTNPDFQPTFKISKFFGVVGTIACFGVMFYTDWIATIAAITIIFGLYFYLRKKQIELGSNDVWKSVWGNIVNKGLKKLETNEGVDSNWNPNILLFTSLDKNSRYNLLNFSKTISGRSGIITDFNLVTATDSIPISKSEQIFKDDFLEEFGIFGRKLDVADYYTGIENIASTYGFNGVEPNTIMMNWSKSTKDPERSTQMIERLIRLDYNLLYFDYDQKMELGDKQTIDIWWRETDSKNAELMLNIARYISQSPSWDKIKIRVLFVNHNNADNTVIKIKISNLLEKLRIIADIKIINNGVEQKSFYEIIELQSAKTDLILLGIPNFSAEKQASYILNTDNLFETVGSTLLVKASNNFNQLDLDFSNDLIELSKQKTTITPLELSETSEINEAIEEWDKLLSETSKILSDPSFKSISQNYYSFIDKTRKDFESTISRLNSEHSINKVVRDIQTYITNVKNESEAMLVGKLNETEELFKEALSDVLRQRKDYFRNVPNKISYTTTSGKRKIKWYHLLKYQYDAKILPNFQAALHEFGVKNFMILNNLSESINSEALALVEKLSKNENKEESFNHFTTTIRSHFQTILTDCSLISSQVIDKLNNKERDVCNDILLNFATPAYQDLIKKRRKKLKSKVTDTIESNILEFSGNWFRNQHLAHNQLESNFKLGKAGLKVFVINEQIKTKTNRLIIKSQHQDITSFQNEVAFVIENFDTEVLKDYKNDTLDKLAEEIPATELNSELKNEEDLILSMTNVQDDLVKLISANSFNTLLTCQNDDVEDIEVSLSNIENYIIRTTYLTPLQESIDTFENVTKSVSEELYKSANLIKYILSEEITDDNRSEFKENLLNAKNRIESNSQELTKGEQAFVYNLDTNTHTTFNSLNARNIIENIESYSKVSLRSIEKSKFTKWKDKKSQLLKEKYTSLTNFISAKKRDVESLKFIEEHKHVQSNIELVSNFMHRLDFNKDVEKELPFYYQKLFTGSHLGRLGTKYNSRELSAVQNAIAKIDNGVSGAIMILGESSSGKSYFVDSITETLIAGSKVMLTPPKKQNFDVNDVHLAFQNVSKISGTADSILNQTSEKKIFIIEDLEQWWVKSENGHRAINYLAKLIEKFGSSHYFIITCNIFSYEIIKSVSDIENQLLTNIIISPANKTELKEILLNRHTTGRAEIWYKESLIEEAKRMDHVYTDIYLKSNGNVGIALGIWKSAIHKDSDGNLYITKSDYNYFPNISNPKWKALLYAFAIHGSLKQAQLDQIFTNSSWKDDTLKELEKTNLILKNTEGKYVLNQSSRHYVEEWLKELTILN